MVIHIYHTQHTHACLQGEQGATPCNIAGHAAIVYLTLCEESAAGLTPGNFSPSAFFLDGSPSSLAANLSALAKSSLSATGSKSKRTLQSPPMSDLKEVGCNACFLRWCCRCSPRHIASIFARLECRECDAGLPHAAFRLFLGGLGTRRLC